MTNLIPKKISALNPASVVNLTDLLAIDQLNPSSPTGYSTRRGTIGQLTELISASVGIVFEDPTSEIGLSPYGGLATTLMRSDAAPALSQSIVPTWTGLHTFSGGALVPTRSPGDNTTNAASTAFVMAAAPAPTSPTATIGLTAVNGSATTSMRSDGAPALSQAIVPTWGGLHTFSAGLNTTAVNGMNVNAPVTSSVASTFVGVNCGNLTFTGTRNTAFGTNVMPSITSGILNVGLGDSSLGQVTSGSNNTGAGFGALFSTTSGGGNTAFGLEALFRNTTGNNNIAIGTCMAQMVSGTGNIAIGQQALDALVLNDINGFFPGPHLAIGNMALQAYNDNNSTGTGLRNTAVGHDSMQALVLGGYNTALGFESGLFAGRHDGSQRISNQTALGALALCYNTDGSNNTAVGCFSMFGNARADSPGFGSNNQVQCTAVGANTLLAVGNASNVTAIGYAALSNLTDGGNNNTVVGANSGLGITTGQNNTILGANAPTFAATTTGLVFIGDGLGGRYFHNFAGSGSGGNLFVGGNSGNFTLTSAAINTGFGNNTLLKLTTGANNTALGSGCLGNLTTGGSNVAIGVNAMVSMIDGISNFAMGTGTLQNQTTGNGSVAIGSGVLQTYTGIGPNTGVGFVTLFELTTGTGNVVFGYNSGRGLTTGSNNSILGGSVNLAATPTLSGSIILADGAGNIKLDYNKTATGAWMMVGNLLMGGATSSFPMIKRVSATVSFRLADDSADASIVTAGITASGVAVLSGGATVPTRTLGDSTTNAASTAFVAAAVTAGTVAGANPSASAGLTAVNGSATTYLRSDGAPAISQAIIPTWTGLHTFNGGIVVPTQSPSDNTTKAASTAYVDAAIAAAGPGVTGANPTASIGLTATNGTSTNFLRSDGAPALSQAIVPTWTGIHTFSARAVFSAGALVTTMPPGDSTLTAASTAFVAAATLAANPTGTIGLTAVNGSATTPMRSDAAPALSQAIVPTWSGLHTFNGGIVVPTRTLGDNTTNAASTAFVAAGFATSGANPSATIGLTAVNGTAASAMRSDGAPALSQAIVPTWSGLHTFSGGIIVPTRSPGDNTTNAASTAFVVAGFATSGANPSATVGLTAVNGSALSAMRSDGAPALSQSIVPTWTGLHTFNGGIIVPTRTLGDSTTNAASTAFVAAAIAAAAPAGFTVAALPVSPAVGTREYVTDALAPTFLAALVGGGFVLSPAMYTSAGWIAA